VHDTLINLSLLADFLLELKRQYDPMSQVVFAYNLHVWAGVPFPHGGAGWLASNRAVRDFHARLDEFERLCSVNQGDDVAMTPFLVGMGIDIMKWQTDRWIVAWPLSYREALAGDIPPCPTYYKLTPGRVKLAPAPVRRAVAVHFHRVDISEGRDALGRIPKNIAVTFPKSWLPSFCKHTMSVYTLFDCVLTVDRSLAASFPATILVCSRWNF
jgi:hypothetical protein